MVEAWPPSSPTHRWWQCRYLQDHMADKFDGHPIATPCAACSNRPQTLTLGAAGRPYSVNDMRGWLDDGWGFTEIAQQARILRLGNSVQEVALLAARCCSCRCRCLYRWLLLVCGALTCRDVLKNIARMGVCQHHSLRAPDVSVISITYS